MLSHILNGRVRFDLPTMDERTTSSKEWMMMLGRINECDLMKVSLLPVQ